MITNLTNLTGIWPEGWYERPNSLNSATYRPLAVPTNPGASSWTPIEQAFFQGNNGRPLVDGDLASPWHRNGEGWGALSTSARPATDYGNAEDEGSEGTGGGK